MQKCFNQQRKDDVRRIECGDDVVGSASMNECVGDHEIIREEGKKLESLC